MEIGKILEDGTIEKEYSGQGFIYKNDENFENKTGICYVSEYGASNVQDDDGDGYETYESMKEQTEQAYKDLEINPVTYPIEKLIAVVFEMLDWQGFGTLLYEVIECLDDECFL